MIYLILGYIVTFIGCCSFIYYLNYKLTVGGLLITIIFSIIPIFAQALAFIGLIIYIEENLDTSGIDNFFNKKLF